MTFNRRSRRSFGQVLSVLLLGLLLAAGTSLRALNHQLAHDDEHGHAHGDHMWHLLGHPHEAPDGHEHHDHGPDDHEHDSDAHVPLNLPRVSRSLERVTSDAPDLVASIPWERAQPWLVLPEVPVSVSVAERHTADPPPPRFTGSGTERALQRRHALLF